MCDAMNFPDTVDEFMETYKIVDSEQVYTNGAELVPIFRMRQWFDHVQPVQERKKGRWETADDGVIYCSCCEDFWDSSLERIIKIRFEYCPYCGAHMEVDEDDL